MVLKYISHITMPIYIYEQKVEAIKVLGINLQVYRFNTNSAVNLTWMD